LANSVNAQVVEHSTKNLEIEGSIPAACSGMKKKAKSLNQRLDNKSFLFNRTRTKFLSKVYTSKFYIMSMLLATVI
jgi:hypothetical protein